jgi:hypothetical protein
MNEIRQPALSDFTDIDDGRKPFPIVENSAHGCRNSASIQQNTVDTLVVYV